MKTCNNCEKEYEQKTSSKYCKVCRIIINKKQRAEAEKRRRDSKKEEINAKRREEYHNSPKRKEMCNKASKRSYERIMNDVEKKKDLNARTKIAQSKYRYKHNFDGNSKLAIERDNFKCISCNSIEKLAIHHVDGKGSNLPIDLQNNTLENLITLCFSCHARLHRSQENENKSSKFVGVWRSENRSGWQSKIRHKGKNYYLGTHETEEDAFDAYLKKKKELDIKNIKIRNKWIDRL